MSDQQNHQNLQQNFQNVSLNSDKNDESHPAPGYIPPQQGYQSYNPQNAPVFNPQNAQTFTPQQQFNQYQQGGYQAYQQQNQYQGYGGYQQGQSFQPQQYNSSRGGYNSRGGYSNQAPRGGYQQYNPSNQQYNPSNQPQAMSLADFEKQKQANLNTLNKPKKTLKLVSSSGIKIANAKKIDDKKDDDDKKPKDDNQSTPVPDSQPESKPQPQSTPAADADADADAGAKTIPTPTPTPTPISSLKQTPKPSKASTPQPEEDEISEEVVRDLFGGKDHISLMFMGHVDAGKSTMGGNLLYLTGSVDKRTVDKYEKEAKDAGRQGWYLSWIMDTNKEERSDGKTIEVGKAYFETEKRRYTILDAPGHKMYVSEMIGGASQADIGVLVISARKGEYETGFEKGGQTREHALLAKNQGVNKIIIVINKMDDPTVKWSEERYKECIKKPEIFLKGIGYKSEDILCMPVSGFTGAGLKERVDPKECPWYKGPSLLEYLDNMDHLDRKINGPFMLPIAGKMKDMGTIVEGKIESGHVKKNQSLILMPIKVNVEVITIYNETEQEADAAYCGEQVRLKLKGVEEDDLSPGFVLSSPKNPVKTVSRFVAQIAIVELKSILSNGFTCVMHLHTAIEEVKIVELKHKLEKGTNRKSKKPPAFAKKGMKVIAIMEVAEPVCAETFNDYPQLGRFTLRDQGTTIAIGKITKLL